MADATELAGYDDDFDTIVDSGMFHRLADWAGPPTFDRPSGRTARRPAADDVLLRRRPDREIGVGEAALRAALDAGGWTVATLEPVTVPGPVTAPTTRCPFWFVTAERRPVDSSR